MSFRPHTAEEGLLSWIERWAPPDAELWTRWRRTLSPSQRCEVLLSLQAALSGMSAFRHVENHAPVEAGPDFRGALIAMRATSAWALTLAEALGEKSTVPGGLETVRPTLDEPNASLRTLQLSLADTLREINRILEGRRVDAEHFQSTSDLFIRDLRRNDFFRPPDPLEFSNVEELIGGDHFPASLDSFASDAAKTTTIVAFLTLLRNHRFLGIADRQIGSDDGLGRAHVIVAGVRRELHVLVRFLLVQGIEALADELETRLLSLDADHIADARRDITHVSDELTELREAVESLAIDVHRTLRASLDEPLPALETGRSLALPAERMRNGIRELRGSIKQAAKELRHLVGPTPSPTGTRQSQRVKRDLRQEVWAFRFILRAFLAKASAAPARADRWHDAENLVFVGDFVRHFRAFGPRLAKATDYPRRGALIGSVSALGRRDAVDAEALHLAARECASFLGHLDDAMDEAPESLLAPFDKQKAAAELRGYLAAARDRAAAERAPAGAFGSARSRIQAG